MYKYAFRQEMLHPIATSLVPIPARWMKKAATVAVGLTGVVTRVMPGREEIKRER